MHLFIRKKSGLSDVLHFESESEKFQFTVVLMVYLHIILHTRVSETSAA